MTTDAPQPLYQLPIHLRPPRIWAQTLNGLLFLLLFIPGCFMVHGFQLLVVLPLKLVPGPTSRKLYDEGIRYTKGAFALLLSASSQNSLALSVRETYFTLLDLMNQWFAPTKLSITFETEGQGRFTEKEILSMVERDASGKVIALHLPSKCVIISNHQVRVHVFVIFGLADPAAALGLHRLVVRLVLDVLCGHTQRRLHRLKEESEMDSSHRTGTSCLRSADRLLNSHQGMQMYRFIFLARSWASDKLQLARQLSKLGKKAQEEDKPFTFILFPEGTLVSKHTRPISRKYAEKMGVVRQGPFCFS